MNRDLLALSWTEMTEREKALTVGFFVKRLVALGCFIVGTCGPHVDLCVLGAALYIDARLALR